MNIFLIYFEFFKIGLFSIGGGLATIPFLFRLADKYEWLTPEMVGNYIAVAQSSPGAGGVNMAAQTGFQYAGIPGAILAALGLVSPAIVVIAVIARMLQSFKENRIVESVFQGLRPAATGLLSAAGFGIWRLTLYNSAAPVWYELIRWKEAAVLAVLFVLVFTLKKHPIVYVAIGAVVGIVLGL
jgi:chromate transporter